MKRVSSLVCFFVVVAGVLGSGQSWAAKAYVTNSNGNTVSVIDTASNQVVSTIAVGSTPCDVAVTRNAKSVYVATCFYAVGQPSMDDRIYRIDGTTGQVVRSAEAQSPDAVAVSPDGKRVYVSDVFNDQLWVYGAKNLRRLGRIQLGTASNRNAVDFGPGGFAFTPDGSRIYVTDINPPASGGQPPTGIAVIDAATEQVVDFINLSGSDIAASPDGSKMYVANLEGLSVIDTTSDQVVANVVISTNQPFFSVAVSPDGSKVYLSTSPYSGCRGGFVAVVDAVSDTLAATIPVKGCPSGLALTPRGRKLYVADFESNTVSVIDTMTNKVRATISDPSLSGPNAVGIR
ncbi:MAG TPA: hypothetical protein VM755_04855 [Stellaceae bacterium]|nr:hypothetical protein [Stellaceae bacterium]